MKFVNLTTDVSREAVLDAIKSSDRVNEKVKFDDGAGRPLMKVKERGETLHITCEMVGGPTKDNEFLVGSFFLGRLRRVGEETRLRGVILTAPIYHLALIAFCVYFIIQSFIIGGITLVPVMLVPFSLYLFKGEFRKQGIIKRYLARAFKYAERSAEGNGNNAS